MADFQNWAGRRRLVWMIAAAAFWGWQALMLYWMSLSNHIADRIDHDAAIGRVLIVWIIGTVVLDSVAKMAQVSETRVHPTSSTAERWIELEKPA